MNWAAHPTIYQLTHWWHWLTYGQNAAVLALIGLAYYTHYTRRMMVAAEETRRLSLSPYLLAEILKNSSPSAVAITNVSAPAVNCVLWMQVVSAQFELGLRLKRDAKVKAERIASIKSGDDPLLIPLVIDPKHPRVLYVIECHDTAGGHYQLQLLQELPITNDIEIKVDNLFMAPDTFFPLWRRYGRRAWQVWKLYVVPLLRK